MPRYDAMPSVGFPLPEQMTELERAGTQIEQRQDRITALVQELALPENALRAKLEAQARRRAAGVVERPLKPHTPGLITGGPMGISGGGDPSQAAATAEFGGSPRWARAVEAAVQQLGIDADKLELCKRAMALFGRM
jgi:hypothetical protein